MNMRLSMKKICRFVATAGSVLTIIFSPVAHGLQSEENLKKQIEGFIADTQLNKRVTYKEFWNKIKHIVPGQAYKDVERYFMQAPNELMPEFKVTESTSSTGEKIPTITITEKGKTYNVQIFGETTKFAKFNNVILSENDVLLFTPAMKRIMASDIKIKKSHDINVIKEQKKNFSGTPKINSEMWSKMNPTQRAQFVLNLRFLWTGAQDVLRLKDEQDAKKEIPQKGKKTSSLEKWNNFFAMIESAQASEGTTALNGTDCVVAGYIGRYGKGQDNRIRCQYPQAAKRSTSCKNPCNELIYGYQDNGTQICLADSDLAKATHFESGCEKVRPLTVMKLALPAANSSLKGSARYKDIVDKNKAEALAAFNSDEKVRDLTKNYLASLLKGPQKELFNSGKVDESLLTELRRIQTVFDTEIAQAREACAKAANSVQYDQNFEGACDQLHRRFLFVAAYLEKKPGCPDSKPINPETLQCKCDTGEVLPGSASCGAPPSPVLNDCKVKFPGVSTDWDQTKGECICPENGQAPVQGANGKYSCSSGGSEVQTCDQKYPGLGTTEKEGQCVCEDGKEPSGDPKKCGSGFNWKPWLIGAGVIGVGVLAWLLLKKKKDKPVTPPPPPPPQGCQNTCPSGTALNPTTCSCDAVIQPPTCTAPQIVTNNICACPATNACTPGQQVYNLSTCQCDTVVQPGICADGVTPYYTPPGSSTCPAPTVCQNGSQVYPPNTCPPINEGGSGNNCPSGNCSGGVPTGN